MGEIDEEEWAQLEPVFQRTMQGRDDKHLVSGPLLKKKVRFVFRFDQWRKSRIQKSKLLEL